MSEDFLISVPDDDNHQLHITRSSDGTLIMVTTNNRQMYGKWGEFGFDPMMARQLIEGLTAVLAGAPRAITPSQLAVENAEAEARIYRANQPVAPASPAIDYDNLFEDSHDSS